MQVVWAATTEVGCGVATYPHWHGRSSGTYIVCQYAPAGNVIGQTTRNVKPLIAGAVMPTSASELEINHVS